MEFGRLRVFLASILLIQIIMMHYWGLNVYSSHEGEYIGDREAQEDPTSNLLDKFPNGMCAKVINPQGYPCKEYTVTTDDGYQLGVQNIPYGLSGNCTPGPIRQPVFLQHGLMAGGDTWFLDLPTQSLGYILADAGFNVWVGNIRCTEWSHGHKTLTRKQKKYWHWTWDDLAAYDLPAMLDFVYQKTGSKIFYIGHSQGTTMLMAGLTGTPKASVMSGQILGAALLAPIAFMIHCSSSFMQAAAHLYVDEIWNALGDGEFNLESEFETRLVNKVCGIQEIDCTSLLTATTGKTCCVNQSRVAIYSQYFPQPSSSMNIVHFGQMIRNAPFSMYDAGKSANQAAYGSSTPPAYDLTALPASLPLLFMSGSFDALSDTQDVQNLESLLIFTHNVRFVILPNYGHLDFVASCSACIDIYPTIVTYITALLRPNRTSCYTAPDILRTL